MKIAVLGWGSLYWDRRDLQITGEWLYDGPDLPIEFARISNDGRLTLVIKQDFPNVTTLHAVSAYNSLEEARENLRVREDCNSLDGIGFFNFANGEFSIRRTTEEIKNTLVEWNNSHMYDAVVWTDLGPNFSNRKGWSFNAENLIRYLNELSPEEFIRAKEYILKAPDQIQTKFRKAITEFVNSKKI